MCRSQWQEHGVGQGREQAARRIAPGDRQRCAVDGSPGDERQDEGQCRRQADRHHGAPQTVTCNEPKVRDGGEANLRHADQRIEPRQLADPDHQPPGGRQQGRHEKDE